MLLQQGLELGRMREVGALIAMRRGRREVDQETGGLLVALVVEAGWLCWDESGRV